MNIIREDKRVNLRKLEIDSCTNCKFAFEDYDLYCMLVYTLSDNCICDLLASFISFDAVSDLDICDLHERRIQMKKREQQILDEIMKEYKRAIAEHSPFNSCHEGYAVILEEVDELWDEIKKKREVRSQDKIIKEATQVGAMVLRFIIELTGYKLDNKEK